MDRFSNSFLEIVLLTTIEKYDSYGYQIIKQIQESSHGYFNLGEGTIYPCLKRLESKGYIKSYIAQASGRNRKYYQITSNGKVYLEKQLGDRNKESQIINLLRGTLKRGFA